MTELLQKALEEALKLSPDQQDTLAAILLEEMKSEQRWAEAFAKSQDQLGKLADEAIEEFEAGKTQPLDL